MALSATFSGRAVYAADYQEGPHRLFVAVACRVEGLPIRLEALLDMGSEWCVMRSDLARHFSDDVLGGGAPGVLSTRFGAIHGTVQRLSLTLIATEGQNLTLDTSWFISEDWPGPMVVGWKGCPERMRFALDPSDESFYFAEL
jgi:hypothetical protein